MSARGMNVVSSARRAERQPTSCRKVKTELAVVERSYGVQQLEPGRAAPSPVERGRRQGMPRPGVGSALRASSGAAIGSGAWAARAAAWSGRLRKGAGASLAQRERIAKN